MNRLDKLQTMVLMFFMLSMHGLSYGEERVESIFTNKVALAERLAPGVLAEIKSDDDFPLKGVYYPGAARRDGVLILHDCESSSEYYQIIAKQLMQRGMHALLLDFRGYALSSTELFSHEKIKKDTKDILQYQQAMMELTSFWQDDVVAAYHYLLGKLGKGNRISIISSGCSGNFAVGLAEKFYLANMVFITPMMNSADREKYKNLNDVAAYFVTSVHHTESYQTTKELFDWNGDRNSRMQLLKGNAYDANLLSGHQYLLPDIVTWLVNREKY